MFEPSFFCDGPTPLLHACWSGDVDISWALVIAGAYTHVTDTWLSYYRDFKLLKSDVYEFRNCQIQSHPWAPYTTLTGVSYVISPHQIGSED